MFETFMVLNHSENLVENTENTSFELIFEGCYSLWTLQLVLMILREYFIEIDG